MDIDQLRNKVREHYFENLHTLSTVKQFHFSSRMWLWFEDQRARDILEVLREEMISDGSDTSLHEVLSGLLEKDHKFGSDNAKEFRKQAIERHPELVRIMPVLYRALWADKIYGVTNAWDVARDVVAPEKLNHIADRLFNDPASVAAFSTHAANFAYLYKKIGGEAAEIPSTSDFVEIASSRYDDTDLLQLQLKLYLLTHVVIGETLFYSEAIHEPAKQSAVELVSYLDTDFSNRFDDINLDNKFEFLVCARICGVEVESESRINQEALNSISPDGIYTIDTHNNNPQSRNTSLARSQHRNVLLVMSGTRFRLA